MVENWLEPFPCLTARLHGYYDISTVGLYCSCKLGARLMILEGTLRPTHWMTYSMKCIKKTLFCSQHFFILLPLCVYIPVFIGGTFFCSESLIQHYYRPCESYTLLSDSYRFQKTSNGEGVTWTCVQIHCSSRSGKALTTSVWHWTVS